MLGAIAGDMMGARFERFPTKRTDFTLIPSTATFTDDTILTVAIADAILTNMDYDVALKEYARKYYYLPYGRAFKRWSRTWDSIPYGSCGNGSAMRVSPVGFAFDEGVEVLYQAKKSAEVTHNHPEGIKGAQAVALAIHFARRGLSKETIRDEISGLFEYNLRRTITEIRPGYKYNTTCQGSVPESIIAFLDSNSYEEAIVNAISLGGDADTMACIAGGIAEAFYGGVPEKIKAKVVESLDKDLMCVVDDLYATSLRI